MDARQMLKLLVPPLFVQGYRVVRGWVCEEEGLYLSGDYQSWSEALADSTGYDAEVILEKTKAAMLKVKEGEAIYERDSVLSNEIQYSWPLLAGLMWGAALSGGRLNVLDFGGSLGSTYFQNRAFLRSLHEVRWNIVEQARHVEVGKRCFEDNQLKFYASIEECLAETKPQIIILSGVLQYLEYPHEALADLLKLPCLLIVDRTPFWSGAIDRLCVQHVPAKVYPASYPCWIFSRPGFRYTLEKKCRIVATFDNIDIVEAPVKTRWEGMIAVRSI